MARADLIYELVKYGLSNDSANFRKATEALCAEERSKQHMVLANKIDELLRYSRNSHYHNISSTVTLVKNQSNEQNLIYSKTPQKRLDHLVLPEPVTQLCRSLIEEQNRCDLLRSYGIEPRNKILLIGPPGNGKTSLAEAIAEALMVPFLTVRYEGIIGSYLGETASRLSKVFEYAKTRQCVLFFDEFETIAKERGDVHETGEIKRVVSSLLTQIDSLPSYVVVIAATNHDSLLDKATWRRFQLRLDIPKPSRANLEAFYNLFEKQRGFSFGVQASTLAKKTLGLSYAEAEEIALEIYRQYVLELPNSDTRSIVDRVLHQLHSQVVFRSEQKGESIVCQKDQ